MGCEGVGIEDPSLGAWSCTYTLPGEFPVLSGRCHQQQYLQGTLPHLRVSFRGLQSDLEAFKVCLVSGRNLSWDLQVRRQPSETVGGLEQTEGLESQRANYELDADIYDRLYKVPN